MPKVNSFEEYWELEVSFRDELNWLREILQETELEEKIKWYIPTYCWKNKNVIGLIRLKDCVGVWFHQGVFLMDNHKLLINAQEGKTKGMRSIKIKSVNDVPREIMKDYIIEAIENQKEGKEIKVERKKELVVPAYFRDFLKQKNIEYKFDRMSLSCRREYVEYIDSAKKEKAKLRRMEKSYEMINENIGLNDKYRK